MKEFLKKIWIALNHPIADGIGGLMIYALCGYIGVEFCSGEPHIPSLLIGSFLIVAFERWDSFVRWFCDLWRKKKGA